MMEDFEKKLETFQRSLISEVFTLFVRMFRVTLSGAVMLPYDMKVSSVKVMNFKDYIQSIPVPSAINLFKMDPVDGHGLMILDSQLIWNLAHVFYGGYGEPDLDFRRDTFTIIEQRLIKRLMVSALEDFQMGWKMITPIKITFVETVSVPEKIDIIQGNSHVAVATIEVLVGRSPDRMAICIPYSFFEPFFSLNRKVNIGKTAIVKDVVSFLNSGYHLSPIPPFVQQVLSTVPKQEKGPDKRPSAEIASKAETPENTFLENFKAESIGKCIIHEHPQTIALILAIIPDPIKKEELLIMVPEKMRTDVEQRLNYLTGIPPGVVSDIESVLTEQIEATESDLRI